MDIGDFAIPLLLALVILVQVASGHAIKPLRYRVEFVSRRRNRPFYRALIHMWIVLALICTAVVYFLK